MITLRPADPSDSESLWMWRNDPIARAASLDGDPVPRDGHERWYAASLASSTRIILIAENPAGGRVGMVRFDLAENAAATVSINIAPEHRGTGVGRAVLAEAVRRFDADHPERRLEALVRETNVASQRLFQRAGFSRESSSGGVDLFVRPASLSSADPS